MAMQFEVVQMPGLYFIVEDPVGRKEGRNPIYMFFLDMKNGMVRWC